MNTIFKKTCAIFMLGITLATANPVTNSSAYASTLTHSVGSTRLISCALPTNIVLSSKNYSKVYNKNTYWLQKNLIVLGYGSLVGSADGKYGPKTTAAVKKFQSDNSLNPDGAAGPKTLTALNNICYDLQKKLNEKISAGLTVDGYLGSGTVNAIKTAQDRMGISKTGIADKDFRDRLANFSGTATVNRVTSVAQLQANAYASWVKPIYANYLSVTGSRSFGSSRSDGRKHAAIDLVTSNGTPVYAMQAGTVIEYSSNFYGGTQAIAVQHADGSIARYCEIGTSLRKGSTVYKGQKIGTVKKNNIGGGTMLHLEIYMGTSSGSLTRVGNYSYNYVSKAKYSRRSDLVNPTFVLNISRSR